LRESIESLSINLYKDAVSNTPSSVATAYIKDAFETQYNYSITSNADNEDTAVEGGSDVTFTITRSGKGSTSTVFIETDDGTTDPYDYNFLNEQKVTFAPDQTTQTMTVKTYSDPNIIGTTTDFSLGLFQYASDTEYTDYSTAYIKNTTEEDDYAYEIDDVEVTQGGKASFTIHRDGSGSESTVYLFTEEDSATSKNFVPLEDVPVVFAANETEKTITVDTIKDNLTGEPVKKYLYLDLYKNHSDLEYETCGMGAIISDKLNKILGATKSDKLTGTQGQDTIDGGGGNDTITGSFGQDILNGGAGKDVFRFTSIKDSSVDMPDIVNDFTKGDKIDLSAIDANSTKVKDQAFTAPVIGDTFSGMFTKEGQLFFETSSETLYGNVNKDGLPDFAIKLSGVIKLAATDFVL
jgi:Ca2+-binding RTX toxin-like protein